jgi:hypothetical protein
VLLGGKDLVAEENDAVFAKGIADLSQRGSSAARSTPPISAPTAVESGSIRV